MLITVQSVLGGVESGSANIEADDSKTFQYLINQFCTQRGISVNEDYVLSKDAKRFRNGSTLADGSVVNGDVVYLCRGSAATPIFSDGKKPLFGCKCNNWWFLSIVTLFIGVLGIIAVSASHIVGRSSGENYRYGIVMDAGSSHTESFVYRWDADKKQGLDGTAAVIQSFDCRSNGSGISTYTNDTDQAGASIADCLAAIQANISSKLHHSTELYLGATAGMRLLEEMNRTQSDQILASVRRTMKTFPFDFDNPEQEARIITGQEEGVSAWVTSNYLLGKFGHFPLKTLMEEETAGALDLGGASTQITFVPASTAVSGEKVKLTIFGASFDVYSHSYLCYGLGEANRRFHSLLLLEAGFNETVINPCGPSGNITTRTYEELFEQLCSQVPHPPTAMKGKTFTFIGSSNHTSCQEQINRLFDPNQCSFFYCSFNNSLQPPLTGQFWAFSGYYYMFSALNLTDSKKNYSLDYFQKTVDGFCDKPWEEIMDIPGASPELCFNAHFALNLLTFGYGFNEATWPSIHFVDMIGQSKIGWSLGFMLNETTVIPAVTPSPNGLSIPAFGLLLSLFCVFVLLAVGFAYHAKGKEGSKYRYKSVNGYGAIESDA